ncbi:hypothetical protein NA57DRAFT_59081 [Rhizodiscina lignyota]|uniref:Uncharacterized protein n=1 Tax=Rhizodiscina lignyota TaxID=1504668 RepID=A0A9P4IAC0_9PEZI|nr:hypothetical protein NA57DRAFT_59081 [Rhizodiscina lignyota]
MGRGSRQPWQALSLQWPFLTFVALVSIGLAAAIQVLALRSKNDGGVIHSEDVDALSLGQSFLYRVLPAIIAVLYSFLWSWINLDVLRLEPFYQLSKSGGASGRQSVLLSYVFDFIATVPIKSLQHGHWAVLSSSVAVLLVLWGLIPVQSGIFAVDGQAVVVVPAFAYLAEGFLLTTSAIAIALLYCNVWRPRHLIRDPSSIVATMALVANSGFVLDSFKSMDKSTDVELDQRCGEHQYELIQHDTGNVQLHDVEDSLPSKTDIYELPSVATQPTLEPSATAGFLSPSLDTLCVIAFVVFNLVTMAVLAVLFKRSQSFGIALPSGNRFVCQLLEHYIPTAVATFIEPVWVLVSRYFGLLQPFEELWKRNRPRSESIGLSYNSYPPQLGVFRAFWNRHFVLAAVCTMALLANGLTIAMASVFFEKTIDVPSSTSFVQTLDSRLMLAPDGTMDDYSDMMSNLTSGTPLKPWTDSKYFYVPFDTASTPGTIERRATTVAFGAELQCRPFIPPAFNEFGNTNKTDGTTGWTYFFNATLGSPHFWSPNDGSGESVSGTGFMDPRTYGDCTSTPVAAEYIALVNTSTPDLNTGFVAGWVRSDAKSCALNTSLPDDKSTLIFCQPKITVGSASVTVDASGVVTNVKPFSTSELSQANFVANGTDDCPRSPINATELASLSDLSCLLTNNPPNFMRAMTRFFIINGWGGQFATPSIAVASPADVIVATSFWHDSSSPSDYNNMFMTELDGSGAILDPTQPAPSVEHASQLLSDVYARMFAALLGSHASEALAPLQSAKQIPGQLIQTETRIFMSKPAFIVSELILSTYVVAIVLVYLFRPGKFLPRYPTSIASVIAYFAASHAVQNVREIEEMLDKQESKFAKDLGQCYGFGAFEGTDGKEHIGIEKVEFLKPQGRL